MALHAMMAMLVRSIHSVQAARVLVVVHRGVLVAMGVALEVVITPMTVIVPSIGKQVYSKTFQYRH